jgi:hypothetical protein
MNNVYEYRMIRIERAAWGRVSGAVFGPVATATGDAGGAIFALCADLIGLGSDEGVLIRAWPSLDSLTACAASTLADLDGVIESDMERLAPSVRPVDATPPRESGVYAHRWFWLQPRDWAEFIALSRDGVWPYFESDGCRILGLWRSMEPGLLAKALLITRYASVAHWERTRLQASAAPPGADEGLYRAAQEAGRRRAEITERSIVRLTRLVIPPGGAERR